MQCLGGALIDINSGYWRESVLSVTLIKCDYIYSECIGGSSNNVCGDGYVGALCKECDYDNSYGRDIYKKCSVCASVEWPYLQIILTSIGFVVYFTVSIYFVAKDAIV